MLVVLTRDDEISWRSVRNLPNVHVIARRPAEHLRRAGQRRRGVHQGRVDAFLAGPAKAVKASARGSEVSADGAAGDAPYGAGSHGALADGAEPAGFPVKGNESSKLYHLPGTSFYNRTEAEVWFASAEDAEKAGFQLPPSQRKEDDK